MKTEIQIFTSDIFGEIRTCQVNNQIMFVGKDVAQALGYAKPRNALAVHVDKDDKSTAPIQGPAYETRVTLINESGLYALILSSKLPQAKAFKRARCCHRSDRRAAISPRRMRKGASSPMKRLSTVPTPLFVAHFVC